MYVVSLAQKNPTTPYISYNTYVQINVQHSVILKKYNQYVFRVHLYVM